MQGMAPSENHKPGPNAGKTIDHPGTFRVVCTVIPLHIIAIVHAFRLYFPPVNDVLCIYQNATL